MLNSSDATAVISVETFNKLVQSVADLTAIVENQRKDPQIVNDSMVELADGWKSVTVDVSTGDGVRQITFFKGMAFGRYSIDNFYSPSNEYWWQQADLTLTLTGNKLIADIGNYRARGLKKNMLTAPDWVSNTNSQNWAIIEMTVLY